MGIVISLIKEWKKKIDLNHQAEPNEIGHWEWSRSHILFELIRVTNESQTSTRQVSHENSEPVNRWSSCFDRITRHFLNRALCTWVSSSKNGKRLQLTLPYKFFPLIRVPCICNLTSKNTFIGNNLSLGWWIRLISHGQLRTKRHRCDVSQLTGLFNCFYCLNDWLLTRFGVKRKKDACMMTSKNVYYIAWRVQLTWLNNFFLSFSLSVDDTVVLCDHTLFTLFDRWLNAVLIL